MIQLHTYITQSLENPIKDRLVHFLHTHLEQFGDSETDISAALNYAAGENGAPGGTVITAVDSGNNELIGAVVLNSTGMRGYIPENILVYIATHRKFRGKGIGKMLMEAAINTCDGAIALHCEPENPARHLYEKLGFTSKYLEMRLIK